MTMAVYLTLSLLTSAFMNWYNGALRWWSAERWPTSTPKPRAPPARAWRRRSARSACWPGSGTICSRPGTTRCSRCCACGCCGEWCRRWSEWALLDADFTGTSREDCTRRRLLGVHQGALLAVHVRLLSGRPALARQSRLHPDRRPDPAVPAALATSSRCRRDPGLSDRRLLPVLRWVFGLRWSRPRAGAACSSPW